MGKYPPPPPKCHPLNWCTSPGHGEGHSPMLLYAHNTLSSWKNSSKTLNTPSITQGIFLVVKVVFTVKTTIEVNHKNNVSVSTFDRNGKAGGFLSVIAHLFLQ